MGGMFAGIMSGYTGAAGEQNQKLMDIEIESRKGLTSLYQSLASNPNVPQELQQQFLEYSVQIPQIPYDKKLPKQFTDMGAIMRQRQQIRPPALPAPGSIPAQPSEVPPPTGEPRSIFHTPGERRMMEAEEAEAETATDLNRLMQYRRAGLLPSGVKRDIQEPLMMPAGSTAMMRDPSGVFTGESLQAPFKPTAGPELSAENRIAVGAYSVKNRIPLGEMTPTDVQKALMEHDEMMRRPEKERVIPVITTDAQGNPVTAYRAESDVLNKAFPRPAGAKGQAAAALDSAKQIYPRLKELSVGIKGLGDWEGKGGIFTTEGAAALAAGTYKTIKAYANLDLDLAEYNSAIQGFIPTFARAVGHTGVLTELDVEKTRGLFPKAGDSRGLAIRKLKNIEMLMEGDAQLAPDWWDPRGLALRPPPDPILQGLTNEELLGFMER